MMQGQNDLKFQCRIVYTALANCPRYNIFLCLNLLRVHKLVYCPCSIWSMRRQKWACSPQHALIVHRPYAKCKLLQGMKRSTRHCTHAKNEQNRSKTGCMPQLLKKYVSVQLALAVIYENRHKDFCDIILYLSPRGKFKMQYRNL